MRPRWKRTYAHVVQQSGSGPGSPAPEVSPSAPHEQDAHAAATAVATGLPRVPVACSTGVGLARGGVDEAAREAAEKEARRHSLNSVRGVMEDVKVLGEDIIEEVTGEIHPNRLSEQLQRTPNDWVRNRLQEIAESGSDRAGEAAKLLRELEDLEAGASRLTRELNRRPAKPKNRPKTPIRSQNLPFDKSEARGAVKGKRTAAKLETKGAGAAVTTVTTKPAATTTVGAKVESAVTSAAATDVKAPTRLSRVGSGLTKLGSVGFHLLPPGPLDALMLMVQFAGSYAAAHEAIRSRNTRTGFSIGLSANLLNRSFGAVREHLSRKFVLDRDVHTQVLGAVGMAEKAHNAGLGAGFHYGGQLSDDARDALREVGFAALAAQGRLPERQELFSAEGVWRLARALLPTVDQIFEAMRVEAERQKRAQAAQEAGERYDRGETGGLRF